MKKINGIISIVISGLLFVSSVIETTSAELKFTEELNPTKNYTMQRELDKLPNSIKKLLIDNNIKIALCEGLDKNFEEGVTTYGVYYWDYDLINLDTHDYSIQYSLLHEVGHALDDILDLSSIQEIQYSYNESEITYENEHFHIDVQEYVAQTILKYYKGTLPKDTNIFKTLDNVLNKI